MRSDSLFSQKKRIAVVGDVMVDEFLFGDVSRISPEAPVPIFQVARRERRLGGAANVANNIAALGGECVLAGLTGPGDDLPSLLESVGIKHKLLFDERVHPIEKTRLIAKNQQLIRIDDESPQLNFEVPVDALITAIGDADIILVSDYGKGLVTPELMDAIRALGRQVLVDPKQCTPALYRGVSLLKPNLEETKWVVGMEIDTDTKLMDAAARFQVDYQCDLLITCGSEGMFLFEQGTSPVHVPTEAQEVYDVTGAGDTVIATIAMALASGRTLKEGVLLANQAAGIAVGKLGTTVVTEHELGVAAAKAYGKVKSTGEIEGLVANLKANQRSIVFTNGCFDVLHIGHARLLQQAKTRGDILIVGLNSDGSARRLKGPERPHVKGDERAEMLSCLECVDYVVFFDEDDPSRLIDIIRPDVHVKGGDYDPNDYGSMPEAKVVHAYGGRVEIIELTPDRSSTNLIDRMK